MDHNNGTSISTQLPIDMVKNVPIEYQHNVCQGVVKKLLNLHFGKRGICSNSVRDEVSKDLEFRL
jgi:hypothetical protein